MVRTRESIGVDLAELARREPAFARVIEQYGVPEPRSSEPGAQTLLRTIVGQQVASPPPEPCGRSSRPPSGRRPIFRSCSPQPTRRCAPPACRGKRRATSAASPSWCCRASSTSSALPADDEEAIALLTKIKGIGRWSAEIYLLFAEGRGDIWPAGDLAVQIEIGKLFGLGDKPSEKAVREIAERWRPHRGAAAVLAWHHRAQAKKRRTRFRLRLRRPV